MKRILFFILFLLTLTAQRYSVQGFVKDSVSGEALEHVTVSIKTTELGTMTNSYGYFSIEATAEIELEFLYVGYTPKTLRVKPSDRFPLTITLSTSDLKGDVVDISAERIKKNVDIPYTGTAFIPIKLIESMPSILGEFDVLKAVQLKSGVMAGQEFSNGIYVRGGTANQNLILLDEVPVYNPNHLFGFFSIFHPMSVKSVDLYKGSIPSEYGGKLSSVLNVSLKEGNRNEYKVSAALSMLSTQLMAEGPLSDKGSFHASYRRTYYDFLLDGLSGNDPEMEKGLDNTNLYFYDLTLKANYALGEKDHLYLSGYFGEDRFDIANIEEGRQHDYYTQLDWGNQAYHLRWTHIWSRKLFSNASFLVARYYSKFFIGADESINKTPGINDTGFKINFEYDYSSLHQFQWGMKFTNHDVEATTGIDSGNNDFKEFRNYETNAYLEHKFKFSNRLDFVNGIHLTQFDQFFAAEPRLNLTYKLDAESVLKFTYNHHTQFMQMLSTTQLDDPAKIYHPSTDYLTPEKSKQIAVGYARTMADDYELSGDVYYKSMSDLSMFKKQFTSLQEDDFRENIVKGSGDAYGFELNLDKPKGKLNGWVNYSFNQTSYVFKGKNKNDPFQPRFHRPHQLNVLMNYNWSDSFNVGAFFMMASGQLFTVANQEYYVQGRRVGDFSEINNYRLPMNRRLDVNLRYLFDGFGLDWEFFISFYNVLGSQNPIITYQDSRNDKIQSFYAGMIPTFGIKFQY